MFDFNLANSFGYFELVAMMVGGRLWWSEGISTGTRIEHFQGPH